MALLASAAAIGLAATPTPLFAGPSSDAFRPPEGALLLTRTLRRPLPDGNQIVTRRTYEVRFVRTDDGYRVDGRPVGVTVEAPPSLEPLATLERRREDAGLFPMHIGPGGELLPVASLRSGTEVSAAVDRASAAIAQMPLGPAEQRQAQLFVRGFTARPALTAWPQRLFRPIPGRTSETRMLPPESGGGRIEVVTEAETSGPTGLLSRFSRKVTTELGTDSRTTYEEWTLARGE